MVSLFGTRPPANARKTPRLGPAAAARLLVMLPHRLHFICVFSCIFVSWAAAFVAFAAARLLLPCPHPLDFVLYYILQCIDLDLLILIFFLHHLFSLLYYTFLSRSLAAARLLLLRPHHLHDRRLRWAASATVIIMRYNHIMMYNHIMIYNHIM